MAMKGRGWAIRVEKQGADLLCGSALTFWPADILRWNHYICKVVTFWPIQISTDTLI